MPLDPRLSRIARRQQNVKITQRRKANARQSGGPGAGSSAFPIYVDPNLLIALDSGDSENTAAIAEATERLDAAATSRYKFIVGTGGSQTYADAVSQYNALTTEEKSRSIMFDWEAVWWDVIRANPSEGIGAGWAADSSIQTEFARQGVNGGTTTGATFAHYKTVARQLYADICDYALGQGSPRAAMFNPSLRVAFFYEGVPGDGFRSTAPTNGRSYWRVTGSYPSLPSRIDAVYENNGYFDSALGIATAPTQVPLLYAAYGYMPSPYLLDSMIALWTDGTAERLNNNGTTATGDFSGDDYRYWWQSTMRAMLGAWCDTAWENEASGSIINGYANGARVSDILSPASWDYAVEAIIQSGPATADVSVSNYLDRNHVCGIWTQTPQARAADYAAALLAPSPGELGCTWVPPAAFWVWDAAYFYWITAYADADYAAASVAEKKQIAQVRCGLEKMFFGRALVAAGEPIGSTTQSDHDTWFAANNLGDAFWKNLDTSTTWRNSSGVDQTGFGSAWFTTGPLAKYLPTTGSIRGIEVKRAIGRWVTEYNVRFVELLREMIAGYGY